MAQPFVLDVNLRVQNILGLDKVKAALSQTASSVGVGGAAAGGGKSGKSGAVALGAGIGTVLPNNVASQSVSNLNKVTKASKNTANAVRAAGKAVQDTGKKAQTFGQQMQLAGTRYAAFALATAAPLLLIGGLIKATQAIIEFDGVLNKLTQILGTSKVELRDLSQSMIQFSVDTGTSLSEIANAGKVLAQAGFRDNIEELLEPLAKIPLLASFESIEQATEGVIATMNQFGESAGSATDILDRFDAVSNKFAITASDLVEGVKRGGGAFAALGGNINEFIALMTTMRSVTRESASTIGTSIRTVVARINRPRTIKFLEGLGVDVRDAQGELLGIIDIFSNLNTVFEASSQEGKAAIAETLGGFRQISRVLAAIQNPEKIQAALKVSQEASGSIARNAEKGLKSLSAQIGILGAKFQEFVQSLASPVFIPLIQGATGFLSVVVSVVSALGPLVPLLTTIVGFAIGIAALGKALSLVGAAGNLVSGAFASAGAIGATIVPGARNIITGGAAGLIGRQNAAGRVQSRLASGVSGAAAGAAGVGQIPQIGAAIALFAVFTQIGEAATEANSQFGVMAASIVKTTVALAVFASLLSKRSIIDIGGSIKSAIIGGGLTSALTVGVGSAFAVIAAGLAAAKLADINIDKLVKTAADRINNLGVEITDTASLNEVGGAVTSEVLDILKGAEAEFEGFFGFVAAFGKRFSAAASVLGSVIGVSKADLGGIAGPIIDEEEIGEFFTTIFEKSPEVFRAMLDQSIEDAGPDFRDALAGAFGSMFPSGADPRIAEIFRNKTIELTGGDRAAQIKVSNELSLAAGRAFAQETKRIADQLNNVIIPSRITSQLSKFSAGLGAVISEINASVTSFQALAGNIGSISAPQLAGETSQGAVDAALAEGGLDFLEPILGALSGFDDISDGAKTFARAANLVADLLGSLDASEVLAGGQSDLNDVRRAASKDIDAALEKFQAATDFKIQPAALAAVKRILLETANLWEEAVATGGTPDPEKIASIQSRILKAFDFGEDFGADLKAVIDAQTAKFQQQLEFQAQQQQIKAGRTTDTGQIENLNAAFAVLDLGQVKGRPENIIRNLPRDDTRRKAISEGLIETQGQLTAKARELTSAYDSNAGAVGPLQKEILELSQNLLILQLGAETFVKLLQKSKTQLEETAQIDIGRAQDSNFVEENIIRQVNENLELNLNKIDRKIEDLITNTQLAQLEVTAKESDLFKGSADTFKSAVASFRETIKDLTTALKPEDVPNTAGPGEFKLDKNGNPVNVPLRLSEVTEGKTFDVQALGGSPEKVVAELSALVKANNEGVVSAFGVGFNTLTSIVATGLNALAGQSFGDIDIASLVNPIAASVSKDIQTFASRASDEQLSSLAAQFATQLKEDASGSNTGADLNTQENLEANILKLLKSMRDGVTLNRSSLDLSRESQQELKNINKQLEITNKQNQGQQPSSKDGGGGVTLVPSEDQRTTSAAIFPPQFAGLANAITAAILTLSTSGETPDTEATAEEQSKKIAEAAERMKVAADTSATSSDSLKGGAQDISTAGGVMDIASKLMSSSAQAFSTAVAANVQGTAGGDPLSPLSSPTPLQALPLPASTQKEIPLGLDKGFNDIKLSSENFKNVTDVFSQASDKFSISNDGSAAANELFRMGVDGFGQNVVSMLASTDSLRDTAQNMQAVVNLQNQSQIDPTPATTDGGGIDAISASTNTEAIILLADRIEALGTVVSEQTAQQAEQVVLEDKEPVSVEGLEANTGALGSGTEAIGSNTSGLSTLGEKIDSVSSAMAEGIGIDVETMSEVKIDVKGISEAAKEFTQEFEDVAVKVAKAEIKIILQKLAAASGNSELSDTFESVI